MGERKEERERKEGLRGGEVSKREEKVGGGGEKGKSIVFQHILITFSIHLTKSLYFQYI